MLYYDLINEKDGVDYRENKDILQTLNNVNLITFTTLLHKTLKEVNTTATDVFFVKYTNKTAKDY